MDDGQERRKAEMARGREIAARHAAKIAPEVARMERHEVLIRYLEGGKITLGYEGKNRTAHCEGEIVAAEAMGEAWPSEGFVARCALAVSALAGMQGVPAHSREREKELAERQRRDEARRHVQNWSKIK